MYLAILLADQELKCIECEGPSFVTICFSQGSGEDTTLCETCLINLGKVLREVVNRKAAIAAIIKAGPQPDKAWGKK